MVVARCGNLKGKRALSPRRVVKILGGDQLAGHLIFNEQSRLIAGRHDLCAEYILGIRALLDVTDLVLLDYKYTNPDDYLRYTGMEQAAADQFLAYLQSIGKPTWLRHVYIPTLNDTDDSLSRLCAVKEAHPCIEKIELLPFRRICLEKYQSMGIPFPLANTPEPTAEEIERVKAKFPQLN